MQCSKIITIVLKNRKKYNVKNNFTEETGEKKDDKNNDNNSLKRWERIKERTNLTIITI